MLEYFVETEFAESLHGVAKECRRPALPQLTYPRLLQGHTEAVDDTAVLSRVDLDAALHQVQRHDGRVCNATAEDATKAAESVELGRTILTAVRLSVCNTQYIWLQILYTSDE